MNTWIKINEHRLCINRIIAYGYGLKPKRNQIVPANDFESRIFLYEKILTISYFNGTNINDIKVDYHPEAHTKRLDAIFNIERSTNAKVSKAND